MNPMHQMKDPAAGVPPQLLPHVHLVSKQRYPQSNNPSLEAIVGYLLEAPKIMHEAQPVQWQMLDCPADGTILLAWQPQELGTGFASDGMVFQDHEQTFNSDVRGYNLQMYLHRSGFRLGEPVAAHSRRRYRLIPSQQNIGGPMPDPSLWLIHYSKSAQRDHVPASTIPIQPQVQAQLTQRRMIQSQGALARKEFMLRDRANWPTINLPGGLGRPAPSGQAPAAVHRRGPSVGHPEPTLEEEEDVSRGDALDFMTPRDISRMRYEQHHEWMEEILESPYATMNIIPPELGLGRKGELEGFTKGFFAAPTSIQEMTSNEQPTRVGKMDLDKAEDFTKIANERLAEMQAELEKMKQLHQKRMEKLKKSSFLTAAEKRLRAVSSEGGRQKSVSYASGPSSTDSSDAVSEIVKEVESSMGKHVDRVKNVMCIEKGGYQEIFVNPPSNDRSQSSMSPVKTMSSAAIQQHSASQQPSNTSQQFSQPPQATPALTPDSSNKVDNSQSVKPEGQQPSQHDHQNTSSEEDVEMEGLDSKPQTDGQTADASDWVMVGDQDLQNLGTTPGMGSESSNEQQGQTPAGMGMTPGGNAAGISSTMPDEQSHLMQQQLSQSNNHTPLDSGDFDMGNDFDDVNTAGDALADYNVDDLNLDMDDSAFGDAFHAHEDHESS